MLVKLWEPAEFSKNRYHLWQIFIFFSCVHRWIAGYFSAFNFLVIKTMGSLCGLARFDNIYHLKDEL